jgi:diguanylate cyclase (GGDEF)-like protein
MNSSNQAPQTAAVETLWKNAGKRWRAVVRSPRWSFSLVITFIIWWGVSAMGWFDPLALGVFLGLGFFWGTYANSRTEEAFHKPKAPEATPLDSTAVLGLVVESTADGIWDWDMVSNEVHWSDRVHQLLGLDPGELARNIDALRKYMHPEDRRHFVQSLRSHLVYHEPFDLEIRIQTPHWDEWHDFHIRGKARQSEQGTWVRMAGSISNISEKRAYLRQLEEQAYSDKLTGLGNRNAFFEMLAVQQKMMRQGTQSDFGVVLLDLDHFGSVNEAYGYQVGDTLLVEIAKELKLRMSIHDHLFRMGGDEFVVICSQLEGSGRISVLLEKINLIFEAPMRIKPNNGVDEIVTLFVNLTSAVIQGKQAVEHGEELMQMLSLAMHRAKRDGMKHIVYTQELEAELKGRRLEQELRQVLWDLRRAMLRDQLFLVFQPIIALKTRKLAGFESLLRWQKGDSMVQPSLFIPLAEQSDLILSIGEWVLRESCRQFKIWIDQGYDLEFLSVNVAAPQLQRQDVPKLVQTACADVGLDPHYLKLEFTESAAMRDVDRVLTIIQRLNLMGVRVSLDDFGTGYSSLGYLRQFNIHTSKIDRSFVLDLVEDEQGQVIDRGAITETIIGMAHNLGLKTIAEGVENLKQVIYLQEHGVDYIQGYYFGRPERPDQLKKALEKTDWQ